MRKILQPFTGNGDVSLWAKYSRAGVKTTIKQTNLHTLSLRFCSFAVFRSTREFFIQLETLALPDFDISFAPMANEQWGFFSVQHLLWHGASVYNGHLRGPVTFTTVANRLAVELSLPIFTNIAVGIRKSNVQMNPLTDCATTAAIIKNQTKMKNNFIKCVT